METVMEERAITDRAKEIISEGATDNIEEENTVVFSETGGEVMVFRIFRRRYSGGDPWKEADQWVWQVKERCHESARRVVHKEEMVEFGRRELDRGNHGAGDSRQRGAGIGDVKLGVMHVAETMDRKPWTLV